jgi:hypothetical protein
MRTLVITTVIVAVQWVLIHLYPEPQWVLLTLTVPALVLALSFSGAVRLLARWSAGGRR